MDNVTNEVKKARAKRIREARTLKLKVTQDELAELCNLKSGARVSNYETAERTPNSEDMRAIAKATNTSFFYLQFGVGTLNDPYWETRPEPESGGVIDKNQLTECIQAIEKSANDTGVTLSPDQIARLSVHIYAEWSALGEKPSGREIAKLIGLIA